MTGLATNRVFVPPANETYAYDADGNQTLVTTGTGAWQVEYNGENRPVKWTCVSPDSSTPNSSTPTLVLMTFDHQGRRRFYVEATAGVTNKLHRFTYDDYGKKVLGQTGIDDLGNVTTDVVGMNVICECKDGQWKFQGASVSLQNTIHMRDDGYSDGKTGPSRKWVLDREKEHAKDAREWLQQQRNDKRWDDFAAKQDGMSYPSKEECQKKVSSALRDALNDALLKEAEASRDKWDKSGKHTWKSREGTRKELMSW